jgi:predicted nucleotidyltransferase
MELIVQRFSPDSIWLFGSRARGQSGAASDWDLLVVMPVGQYHEALEQEPLALRRAMGINADIVFCDQLEFQEGQRAVAAHAAFYRSVFGSPSANADG